jgi:hypothetical protein
VTQLLMGAVTVVAKIGEIWVWTASSYSKSPSLVFPILRRDTCSKRGQAFNVIIPLILANDTGPELDLRDSEKLDDKGSYWLDDIVTSTTWQQRWATVRM